MQENNQEVKIRHSLAHIMTQAEQKMIDPNLKLGIGPRVDNGFYHDFISKHERSEKDFKTLEKEMQNIIKQGQDFVYLEIETKEAINILKNILKQPYTAQLCEDLAEKGEKTVGFYINTIPAQGYEHKISNTMDEYKDKYENITKYFVEKFPNELDGKFVTFVNMCKGPHVENSKEIDQKSFKLAKVAGAYWKGDENNIMMTRIYGYAFQDKEKLKDYLAFLEEAKKRDHRVLGKKLGLYSIDQENVGSGLILRKPKGAFIVNQIKRRFEDEQLKAGYVPVITPHIGKKSLREKSGHWGFYNDGMFPPLELGQTLEDRQDNRKAKETETYLLKPMNCPFHVSIFKDDVHSYKDLPIKYYEFGTVYRYEQKGELGGLTRVRGFTQDDAHIIVSKDKLKDEFGKVVDFALRVLNKFDFKDINIFASFRDPNNKKKYLGSDEMWNIAEGTIKEILIEKEINFTAEEGEAAFYGPKIDFKVKDVIGRQRQLSTVQFDFNLSERFDMSFINKNGEKEQPFMIHRALLGSLERFMGVLIENYAGSFPLRLAPEQIRIIPVADKFVDYAKKIQSDLIEKGYRIQVDNSDDSFAKKIRNGEIMKIPSLFVVGEQEEKNNTVNVRDRDTKKQQEMTIDEFLKEIKE